MFLGTNYGINSFNIYLTGGGGERGGGVIQWGNDWVGDDRGEIYMGGMPCYHIRRPKFEVNHGYQLFR